MAVPKRIPHQYNGRAQLRNMEMLKVDPRRCPQNHRCPLMRICPRGAISQEGFGLPAIDSRKCIGCMACVNSCPMGAVQLA
jgi:ferredoxin